MDMEKMGGFIAERRHAKQLTQRELAEALGVTDKAVSKWERGLSCPDVALLTPLALCLDVTVEELLTGEKVPEICSTPELLQEENTAVTPPAENLTTTEITASKKKKRDAAWAHRIAALIFTAAIAVGVLTCGICAAALHQSLSPAWAYIAVESQLFAWLVLLPVIQKGREGLTRGLVLLTAAVFPYLFLLRLWIDAPLLLPVGWSMAAISLAYLWGVWLLCRKKKGYGAAAWAVLLTIPLTLVVNITLSFFLSEGKLLDGWDVLSFAIEGIAAGILFTMNSMKKRRTHTDYCPPGLPGRRDESI